MSKKKVVVLGGGVAAMSTAYHLTSQPNWSEFYDVTLYQLGWRLGGKGASGRNPSRHQRIEEHGLHVWGGFYENAFSTMRGVYKEARRPPNMPLHSVETAFKPQPFVVWEEQLKDGSWAHWPMHFPTNSEEPGTGGELPSAWAYVEMMVGWIRQAFMSFPLTHIVERARTNNNNNAPDPQEHNVVDFISGLMQSLIKTSEHVVESVFDGSAFWMLQEAVLLTRKIIEHPEDVRASAEYKVVDMIGGFIEWLQATYEEEIWAHTDARRLYILMSLGATVIRGMIVDGVIVDGFPIIDDYDLKEWLRRHGASELVVDSTPVWAYYDYFFAYDNGDTELPSLSAGMGLNHLLRLVAAYKGAIFWEMQAGMGDAVFSPMYEVLKRRGVTFEFFHQVENLGVDDEEDCICSVRLSRQAEIKEGIYDPLVEVKDLPCWPSEPHWDQLKDGQKLKDSGVNFEDRFSTWEPVETYELKVGEDYDYLVLGISIGEFPYICKDILERDPDWRIMCDEVTTIQTMALQLWFKPDAEQLGWTMPKTIMTGYAQPLETWADMSHVIDREDWPAILRPGNIAYYCGPLKNPDHMPEGTDPGFGPGQKDRARAIALGWLGENLNHLMPDATIPGEPNKVDWSLLVDQDNGQGQDRFDAQYVRANYTPTERYVISRPGTNRFRMTTETSNYKNLVLAGDWVYTGLGGSVEGAMVAGMQASRTLTCMPQTILGEPLLNPWQRATSVHPFVDMRPQQDE